MNGKFAAVPVKILGDQRLRPLDIVVYVALDSFADGTGEAWPSLPVLAERAGVSLSTVKRALLRLEGSGYVVRLRRTREGSREFESTLYRLTFRNGEVGPEEMEAGPSRCAGSVPPDREVGPRRAGNYTHITITKEREYAGEESRTATLERCFEELWERYPRRRSRGEARKAFMALFPANVTPEAAERRLRALEEQFLIFEDEARRQIERGEERFIPCLHNWLAREGFADV